MPRCACVLLISELLRPFTGTTHESHRVNDILAQVSGQGQAVLHNGGKKVPEMCLQHRSHASMGVKETFCFPRPCWNTLQDEVLDKYLEQPCPVS